MKKYIVQVYLLILVIGMFNSCSAPKDEQRRSLVHEYEDILDISYTPNDSIYCKGWFSDKGSWMGFTIPQKDNWVNGFCGPFNLESRYWLSSALVTVGFAGYPNAAFQPDSVNYFPGELFMSSSSDQGTITQRLFFVDKSTALLECTSNKPLCFYGQTLNNKSSFSVSDNSYTIFFPSGDQCMLTFPGNTMIQTDVNGYEATMKSDNRVYIVISFLNNPKGQTFDVGTITDIQLHPAKYISNHYQRWENYLNKVLRTDMPEEYNRIAVKSIVTLITNWRSSQGGLLHDGVLPSHAAGYFIGFWAWDSWKFAVALAGFAPDLAKNQVRAMFDYQLDNGMVIDCIYPDIRENNARDSKPPLAAWAVAEIFKETSDTSFVKEMYPQLLSYYRWWYVDRDHNSNGICEFGSVDGTLEAAAWESGMDNAIRFDDAKMVKNSETAWSLDQESVDLNAYLAYEYSLLQKLAAIAEQPFNEPDHTQEISTYFYDEKLGFFFDKRLNGTFVEEMGCEAYIPFWTGIASKEQMESAMKQFTDTTKFSTYIPFPTVAADNPKFMAKGYWRGPIWLDQTYYAISGLRKYGYVEEADKYTCQVFDRLQGLKGNGVIHENYGTHTGEPLKAPHFSWSSAHLLMLYKEYGKQE